MPRKARTSLQDILEATNYLLDEAPIADFAAYEKDKTLRLAVERTFMSIGEAVAILRRDHPAVFDVLFMAMKSLAFAMSWHISIGPWMMLTCGPHCKPG